MLGRPSARIVSRSMTPRLRCEKRAESLHRLRPQPWARILRRLMATESFPIDLSALKPLKLDPSRQTLTAEERDTLKHNIQLCRDTIVFFTAVSDAKGLTGHTGGAYDHMPEVNII